jgi:hypothetical protein
MKGDYSYVNVKYTYAVALKALARYCRRQEEMDAYRLTAYAVKTLAEAVALRGGKEFKGGKNVR